MSHPEGQTRAESPDPVDIPVDWPPRWDTRMNQAARFDVDEPGSIYSAVEVLPDALGHPGPDAGHRGDLLGRGLLQGAAGAEDS